MKKTKKMGLRYCWASRMFFENVEMANPRAESERAASATIAMIAGKVS
jgi:hypothetical protein